MHDFGMLHGEGPDFDPDRIDETFREAFARIWSGEVENDGFNRLVLRAGIGWHEIVILRAYCKYLRQAGGTFSETYMQEALAANPHIAALLVELFLVRLDPARQVEAPDVKDAAIEHLDASLEVMTRIEAALDEVANLDEDRILRSYIGVIRATLRTNYFQRDAGGSPKTYVSFKFDPRMIPELPEPRPKYEIFVYSPRVEGVHLRSGTVARGGIRWSDRREDFRTEVLGLAKAQQVKNAVIVPVGSKGGFVPKKLPVDGGREAVQEEGIACYRILHPRHAGRDRQPVREGRWFRLRCVVRHDEDDPYLVVAADKGTATFSDIANALAHEYGFWLGDAFASGGSQGYDHKGMGITARGGWESVKRHFRELGVDCQSTDFTATGIGDMGGDVFGNGMLLSRHIRLVGAFNHMHVFIDPDPDPESTFVERERLFALPRSTWDDFDRSLLSAGGGIYSRSAKSIPLSPEARAALAIDCESLTPNELIAELLKTPVDLLWNGGIGTYVKSERESHADVGDRANDVVRVNGNELRCRIVGEGGNLGLTQLGRIEYAANGGRVNTDAIDNSGGVDCSDHEVNIKVLLNEVVSGGDMTEKQRNRLLQEMTDEVGELVLRNNYLQTQALSVAASQATSLLEVHSRLIRRLERDGELDREIEFVPGAEEIADRLAAKGGLFTPELSVLIAYVKIRLFQRLLASTLPDEPFVANELRAYFPSALRDRHAGLMPAHRLAREVVSTVVANEMVNRCGTTFAFPSRGGDRRGRCRHRTGVPHRARRARGGRDVGCDRGPRQRGGRRRPDVDAARDPKARRAGRALAAPESAAAVGHRARHRAVRRGGDGAAPRIEKPRRGFEPHRDRCGERSSRRARRSRGPGAGGRERQRFALRDGCRGGRDERRDFGRGGGIGVLRAWREAGPALAAGPDRGTASRQPLAGAVTCRVARRSLRAVERADTGHVAHRCRRGNRGRTRGGLAGAEPDPGRPVPSDSRRSGERRPHRLHHALRRDGRDPHPAPD